MRCKDKDYIKSRAFHGNNLLLCYTENELK